MQGDGNCLFRALCYAITGPQREHFKLRTAVVAHLRSLSQSGADGYLIENYMPGETIEGHLTESNMDRNGSWGTDVEIIALAHLLGVNITTYSMVHNSYVVRGPWLVDPAQQMNNSLPTIYLSYTGDHFNVVISQV